MNNTQNVTTQPKAVPKKASFSPMSVLLDADESNLVSGTSIEKDLASSVKKSPNLSASPNKSILKKSEVDTVKIDVEKVSPVAQAQRGFFPETSDSLEVPSRPQEKTSPLRQSWTPKELKLSQQISQLGIHSSEPSSIENSPEVSIPVLSETTPLQPSTPRLPISAPSPVVNAANQIRRTFSDVSQARHVSMSGKSYSLVGSMAIIVVMLLSGTTNTIFAKLQDKVCLHNCTPPGYTGPKPSPLHPIYPKDPTDPQPVYFEQPLWQTLNMFIGEWLCLVIMYGIMAFRGMSGFWGWRQSLYRTYYTPDTLRPPPETSWFRRVPTFPSLLGLMRNGDQVATTFEGRGDVHDKLPVVAETLDGRLVPARIRSDVEDSIGHGPVISEELPPVQDLGYNPYPYVEESEYSPLLPDNHERTHSVDSAVSSVESERGPVPELKGWKMLLLWIPAMCDILGTTLSNIALIYTSASIYQMLRGSIVFSTGIMSVMFLRRHLAMYQWFSLLLVMLGIGIVGATPLLEERFKMLYAVASQPHQFLGVWMVLLAQVFTSSQFIIEERILSSYKVHPLLAVGLEGTFGILTLLLFVPPIWYFYGRHHHSSYFNIGEGWKDFTSTSILPLSSLGSILSVAIFNWCGLEMTRRLSATNRSTIDACRTLLIWAVSLYIGWERFSWWQVLGFVAPVVLNKMESNANSFVLSSTASLKQIDQTQNDISTSLPSQPSNLTLGTSKSRHGLFIDTRANSRKSRVNIGNSSMQLNVSEGAAALPPLVPPMIPSMSMSQTSRISQTSTPYIYPIEKSQSYKSSSSSLQPQISTPTSDTPTDTPTSVASDATMVEKKKVTPYSSNDKDLPPSILRKKLFYRNRVRILGLAYSTLYVAAGVISSFLTSIFATGFYAMACTFTFYGISSLFVPSIAAALPNLKYLMFIGGGTFMFYFISVAIGNLPLFLVASCINGFGIALLWGSQGMYQSKVAEQAGGWAGFFVGQFQTMFALNGLIGNTIAIAIIYAGIPINYLIYVMIGVACLGVGLMTLIDPLTTPYQSMDIAEAMGTDGLKSALPKDTPTTTSPTTPGGTPVNATVLDRLKMIWDVATHKPGCYLLPWMGLFGYSGLISGGRVPKLATELLGKDVGYRLIPIMMICYAFGATVTSTISGKWMDKKGWKPLLALHGSLVAIVYGLLYFEWFWTDGSVLAKAGVFLVIGLCFGIMDNLTSTLRDVSILRYYPGNQATPVYAMSRFAFCVFYASSALVSTVLAPTIMFGDYVAFYVVAAYLFTRAARYTDENPTLETKVELDDDSKEAIVKGAASGGGATGVAGARTLASVMIQRSKSILIV